jgi:hypothetical protein
MRLALVAIVAVLATLWALPADASHHARTTNVVYSPGTLPNGVLGKPYYVKITVNVDGASCCIAPNNADAPGLQASTPNGAADSSMELRGVPTRTGTYYLITEIYIDVQNGIAKDTCCVKQWTFTVVGGKSPTTPVKQPTLGKPVAITKLKQALGLEDEARRAFDIGKPTRAQRLVAEAADALSAANSALRLSGNSVSEARLEIRMARCFDESARSEANLNHGDTFNTDMARAAQNKNNALDDLLGHPPVRAPNLRDCGSQ